MELYMHLTSPLFFIVLFGSHLQWVICIFGMRVFVCLSGVLLPFDNYGGLCLFIWVGLVFHGQLTTMII